MSEKDKKILDTFSRIIPELSELEKEKLLAFGEGMAFKADQQRHRDEARTLPVEPSSV